MRRYGSAWGHKRLFCSVLDKYTRDNTFLVALQADSKDMRLVSRFRWYKASEPEEAFQMGSVAYQDRPEDGSDVYPRFRDGDEADVGSALFTYEPDDVLRMNRKELRPGPPRSARRKQRRHGKSKRV